jgi:hypothetical protein
MQINAQGRNFDKWCILIVLNNKETKDVTSFSEEDKDKMPIVIERDIQEFKDTNNVLNMSIFKFIKH